MYRYKTDFHKMIVFATKVNIPLKINRKVFCRSYKRFKETDYLNHLLCAPFHVCEIFDDRDDSYWFAEMLLSSVINDHAPVKCKAILNTQVPSMNGELRKNINHKNMLTRRYNKNRSNVNWENRSKVTWKNRSKVNWETGQR